MTGFVVQAQDRVTVVNPGMRKVDINRAIRTRTAGNNKLIRSQRFHRTVVTFQGDRVFINKTGIPLQNFAVIALVKSLPHTRLLINNVISVVENIGKRRTKESGVVAVQWVLIEFNNAADGVAEGFRRDGAPVGTASADVMIALNHRDARSLLNQTHCSAFAAGTGTYYYCIVIVGM